MATDEMFAEVEPDDLTSFLTANDWILAEPQPGWIGTSAQLWVHGEDGAAEVLVPLRRSYRDYGRLIEELCKAAGEEMDLDPRDVLKRITSAAFDTVRFRAQPGTQQDSLPLDDALLLISSARAALSAAAASAVEPRPKHPSRRPAQAEAYLTRLEMAQTERGSFVVAIRSPIGIVRPRRGSSQEELAARPSAAAVPTLAEDDADDFTGRSVPLTLVHAVDSLRSAAEIYRREGDVSVFESTIYDGVSSNLCQAMSSLADIGDSSMRLSVAWSAKQPLRTDDQPDVDGIPLDRERVVPSDLRVSLETAADYLSSLETFQPVVLRGSVTNLKRARGEMLGQATVVGEIGGRRRSIKVLLPLHEYSLAITAHETERLISLVGVPRKQGRSFVIDSPANVELL